MEKSFIPKGDVKAEWLLVNAEGSVLGRLATEVAHYLLGKHKTYFTPGMDIGDFVVVVNAQKITVTGNRLTEKEYNRHSGYPGGLKTTTLKDQILRHPDRVIKSAVWGMLPHNKLGRRLIKKLKIYAGNEHPHVAQNPRPVK